MRQDRQGCHPAKLWAHNKSPSHQYPIAKGVNAVTEQNRPTPSKRTLRAFLIIKMPVRFTGVGVDLGVINLLIVLVLELVPAAVARALAAELSVPVIGIGAGVGVSGQVLVLHDLLNVTRGKLPRFVRNFLEPGLDIAGALALYVAEVKAGRFPDDTLHSY